MKKLLFLWVVLGLAGCAGLRQGDLYGVKIERMMDDKIFQIQGFRGGQVQYTSAPSLSKEVTAWGKLKGRTIVVTLRNASAKSIKSDYFFDKFTLVAKDGTSYQLEKEGPTVYRYRLPEIITTGEAVNIVLRLPQSIQKENIDKVVCEIGLLSGTRVVLKPVP